MIIVAWLASRIWFSMVWVLYLRYAFHRLTSCFQNHRKWNNGWELWHAFAEIMTAIHLANCDVLNTVEQNSPLVVVEWCWNKMVVVHWDLLDLLHGNHPQLSSCRTNKVVLGMERRGITFSTSLCYFRVYFCKVEGAERRADILFFKAENWVLFRVSMVIQNINNKAP